MDDDLESQVEGYCLIRSSNNDPCKWKSTHNGKHSWQYPDDIFDAYDRMHKLLHRTYYYRHLDCHIRCQKKDKDPKEYCEICMEEEE